MLGVINMTQIKKYHTLKSKYYSALEKDDIGIFTKELDQRLKNELAIYTGLIINPFIRGYKTSDKFEIFYLPICEMSILEEQIYALSTQIRKKQSMLPLIAQNQLFMNSLIDELKSTNDIEGVHSSKKELGDAMSSILANKSSKKRFKGLVNQYMKFQKNEYNEIKEVKEFRTIWNVLVSEEIEKKDFPDGNVFRKNQVNIMDGEKVVHRGDSSEEKITRDLQLLVEEMNNENLPCLPKCFISHYFYEYVHPFYDGNGRTGRFIICSYLSRKLDAFSAINFSSAIIKNKSKYYGAFSEMSDPKNHGEATKFILSMMEILKRGQRSALNKINEGIEELAKAKEIVKGLDFKDSERSMMFIFFQKYIFGDYVESLKDKDLVKISKLSRFKVNKILKSLEEKKCIIIKNKNPKIHSLSPELIKKYELNQA